MRNEHGQLVHEPCGHWILACKCPPETVSADDRVAYWEERFRDAGPEAVLRYGDTEAQHAAQTDRDRGMLRNLIDKHAPKARKVYEYGCGWGRLAMYLASQGFAVLGSEPARRAAAMAAERGLTVVPPRFVRDGWADLSYTWTCLQHLGEEDLAAAVDHIQKSTRSGGTVILVENTTPGQSPIAWVTWRQPEEYAEMFDSCELVTVSHHGAWPDSPQTGQEHSAIVLRRRA